MEKACPARDNAKRKRTRAAVRRHRSNGRPVPELAAAGASFPVCHFAVEDGGHRTSSRRPHDDARLPYHRALSRDLRASFLVLNPGTVPARGYFAVANVVVTFEGPYASYAAWREPDWLDALRARSAHLVYAASRAQARALLAAPRRAGYLYVT